LGNKWKLGLAGAIDYARKTSAELQSADEDKRMRSLGEIRNMLINLDLLDLAAEAKADGNACKFTALYLLRSVVSDVWTNLGTDASFGFETILHDSQFIDFMKNLGLFIAQVLDGKEESSPSAFNALARTITDYYGSLLLMRERGEQINA
jgi:hypothetical protein